MKIKKVNELNENMSDMWCGVIPECNILVIEGSQEECKTTLDNLFHNWQVSNNTFAYAPSRYGYKIFQVDVYNDIHIYKTNDR